MRTSLLSWTGKNYPEPEAPSHLTILRPREVSGLENIFPVLMVDYSRLPLAAPHELQQTL